MEFFSSRREIELMMIVLGEWLEQNPNHDKRDSVIQMLLRLEYLHMSW